MYLMTWPLVMYHMTWPCIDGKLCIIWHDQASLVGDVSDDMTGRWCITWPCIDGHIIVTCIDGRWCIMWHDQASMVGDTSHDIIILQWSVSHVLMICDVSNGMTMHRRYVMYHMTWRYVMYHMAWPGIDDKWCIICIDGKWCIIWHVDAEMVVDVSYDMTMHK